MLKSFSVKNFRNLNVDNLQFKRINIFIGPNNSGKTNFISAISFFTNLLLSQKKDSAFLEQIGKLGWDDILNKRVPKPGVISLKWVIDAGRKYSDISYELEFQVGSQRKDCYISKEMLAYKDPMPGKKEPYQFINCHGRTLGKGSFAVRDKENKKPRTITVNVSESDSVFRQLKSLLAQDEFRMSIYPNFSQIAEAVQEFFERFYAYSSTRFDLDLVREPVDVDLQEKSLSVSGSNFINVLNNLDGEYDFIFKRYINMLTELIHDLERIRVLDYTEKKKGLELVINNLRFKLSEMSDGTVKAMLLALLLWSQEKMTILAIDEPELNMHPAWLKVIANWVMRSDSADQIFISTHSPDLLDSFTTMFREGEVGVFVFSLAGEQTIKQLLPATVMESLEEGWELGDLYRVGDPSFGGWPW